MARQSSPLLPRCIVANPFAAYYVVASTQSACIAVTLQYSSLDASHDLWGTQ
ncbi:hypothetical protein BDW22DRAFT_1354480 [Trametopsis cervina]|nr:hypothetical protein BDW22DRAFT_1354480 [Trametopsis cervina]